MMSSMMHHLEKWKIILLSIILLGGSFYLYY
uniref:Uncharacterized protein n=1 Tax=Arundo donax TaxID=35708 RepID=A0A0A9C9X7_ARUDO